MIPLFLNVLTFSTINFEPWTIELLSHFSKLQILSSLPGLNQTSFNPITVSYGFWQPKFVDKQDMVTNLSREQSVTSSIKMKITIMFIITRGCVSPYRGIGESSSFYHCSSIIIIMIILIIITRGSRSWSRGVGESSCVDVSISSSGLSEDRVLENQHLDL